MNRHQGMALLGNANAGVIEHLQDTTVQIRCVSGEDIVGVGSGTCVKVGNRYFIATAAHVIRGHRMADVAVSSSRLASKANLEIVNFGMTGGGDYDAEDCGFLEVEGRSAVLSGKKFVEHLRTQQGVAHAEDDLVVLSGYPAELLKSAGIAGEKMLFRQALGYMTGTEAPANWPNHENPNLHIFAHYPKDDNVLGNGTTAALPSPQGMSGGGIWKANILGGAQTLWSPDAATLIGTIVSFKEKERWVRGHQIQEWLQLVESAYPEFNGWF